MNSKELLCSETDTKDPKVNRSLLVAGSLRKQLLHYEPPTNIQKKIKEILTKNSPPIVKQVDDSVLSKEFVFDCTSHKIVSESQGQSKSHRRAKSLNISNSKDKIRLPLFTKEKSDIEPYHTPALKVKSIDNQSTAHYGSMFNDQSNFEPSQDIPNLAPSRSIGKLEKDGKKVLKMVLQERSTDFQNIFSTTTSRQNSNKK